MQFPHYFHLFGLTLHPHPVMELIAYLAGLSLHLTLKSRLKNQNIERNLWHLAGAITGALAGAKLLNWIESFHQYVAQSQTVGLEAWIGGKTIVGGLIGGWIGVEIAKHFTHSKERTGDTWVYPLILSLAIGRIGCFLTGLSDQTHGNPTNLPWAVDFGDHIPRHPTQLYEIAFLLLLGITLAIYQYAKHLPFTTGKLFRLFMLAYCSWRFAVEFIKPTDKPFLGLSAIQLASFLTVMFCTYDLWISRPRSPLKLSPTTQ
jgi:phosphatidylglycerol---prolipoprotein diacylglyceryl transferase